MNRNTLLLLGVFVLGCAAGMHADSRAHARTQTQTFPAPTTVRKWQQFCSDHQAVGNEINNVLRQKGEEGWELVSVTEHQEVFKALLVCFKRPAE
ncbi:hypothetical protein [Pyxidicoccus trucidator]|uniref:hypothetical protein n=1 Tax=Pyxidicoccus trucidator TaxID=2709662 RepID=UPI0013DC42C5|nr:hypothetical protein [Pyxidicoccus trucidator]